MKLIVKCQCCGREVEAKNPKKKYCSPLCAKQMQRKKYATYQEAMIEEYE